MSAKKLGWIADLPDHRDLRLFQTALRTLPDAHDLKVPFIYDQGELGSCTAQATCAAIQYLELKQDGDAPIPSRLSLYYMTRREMGTTDHDSGASIRGVIKAAAKHGVCRETLWPYDTSRFKEKPSSKAILEATNHRLSSTAYARVGQNLYQMKSVLHQGHPIVFGFSVPESFMGSKVKRTGIMDMPKDDEKIVGGHCSLVIGYDDKRKAFLVQNSWGHHWGILGKWWFPYDAMLNNDLCDDFWCIYKVKPLT